MTSPMTFRRIAFSAAMAVAASADEPGDFETVDADKSGDLSAAEYEAWAASA